MERQANADGGRRSNPFQLKAHTPMKPFENAFNVASTPIPGRDNLFATYRIPVPMNMDDESKQEIIAMLNGEEKAAEVFSGFVGASILSLSESENHRRKEMGAIPEGVDGLSLTALLVLARPVGDSYDFVGIDFNELAMVGDINADDLAEDGYTGRASRSCPFTEIVGAVLEAEKDMLEGWKPVAAFTTNQTHDHRPVGSSFYMRLMVLADTWENAGLLSAKWTLARYEATYGEHDEFMTTQPSIIRDNVDVLSKESPLVLVAMRNMMDMSIELKHAMTALILVEKDLGEQGDEMLKDVLCNAIMPKIRREYGTVSLVALAGDEECEMLSEEPVAFNELLELYKQYKEHHINEPGQ